MLSAKALLGLAFVLANQLVSAIPPTVTVTVTVPATNCPDPTCRPTTASHIAKYDDLPFTEPDLTPPPPVYLGLSYANFFVDQYDGFIPPHSFNNTLLSFDSTQPRFFSVNPPVDAPASARWNYYFDLKSMYVACSQGYPQDACVIDIYGVKAKGGAKITKTVTYPKLDSSVGFSMMKVEFTGKGEGEKWKGLREVGFSKAAINGQENTLGLVIDDVEYVVAGCA